MEPQQEFGNWVTPRFTRSRLEFNNRIGY